MPAKPTTHLELIEPLQSFLETLAQELTEQKFVPALQGELQKLQNALAGLEQAEATLQQIARGVDRLREVFAPAGTRLLEGVKDVETILRNNAGQLREQADTVLQDLVRTHEQLETALRNEASTLTEQTSVSREMLGRTIADVDSRLAALNTQVETLCQRLDGEAAAVQPVSATVADDPARKAAPMPADLQALVTRSEQTIARELERHHQALASTLAQSREGERERLLDLDKRVEQALAGVGPRVQEELDSAVLRLRDQLQTLLLAELETRAPHGEPHRKGAAAVSASAPELNAVVTGSETRLLRELATIEKEQGEAARLVRELAKGLEGAAVQQSGRAAEENRALRESLAAVTTLLTDATTQERERLTTLHRQMETLTAGQGTQLERAEQAATLFDEHTAEMRLQLSTLSAAVERAREAALTASEKALSGSQTQQEHIAGALRDLRQQLDGGLSASEARLGAALQLARDEWLAALAAFRDYAGKALAEPLTTLTSRFAETRQQTLDFQQSLHNDVGRFGSRVEQQLDALQSHATEHGTAVTNYLNTVTADLNSLRARQDQALVVLKDTIHANYDENVARFRETIETAYENFAKQISQVPQALERYTHLLQSLHQGDQLALQAISSDTRNLIALSTEKFELLATDGANVKKLLPLLDRKLEKHSAEMELVRKAQVRHDKDLSDISGAIAAGRNWQDERTRDLRRASDEQFEAARAEIADVQARLKALADDNLPALRRDLIALVTGKFEFIEGTLHERLEALRQDLMQRFAAERKAQQRLSLCVALLLTFSIGLQLFFHLSRTPGAGQ